MTPSEGRALAQIYAPGRSRAEQQALARHIVNDRYRPLDGFDHFMNWAVLFGPIVIGFGVGYWLS